MLVYLEDMQKKKYLIDEDNFKIGRDGSQCQLKLPNNRLFSALQAIIVVQDDVPIIEKYVLVDQSSNRNTLVNGQNIEKRVLRNGDRISFSQEQDFCVTFKINTSAPTLVPRNEGYIKPQLEEQEENLLSTIKETGGNVGTPQIIDDKEIEDLRSFMQKSISKRNQEKKDLSETKEDICVGAATDNEAYPEMIQVQAEEASGKPIQIIGEETEVDLENPEKMKVLKAAYDKISNSDSDQEILLSVLDGHHFLILGTPLLCGASQAADIRFPQDAYITPENFKILKGKDGTVINPFDNNNVLLNGVILRESQKLKHQDIIRVGRQIFYYLNEKKQRRQIENSVTGTKSKVKNFYGLQNIGNQIDFCNFDLQIQTKFNEKENTIYAIDKNESYGYLFIGDLIGTSIGFALIAQELRGVFSAAVSQNMDLGMCAANFDRVFRKYDSCNCENIPLLGKGLLFRFNHEHLEWLNMGGYLTPILMNGNSGEIRELSCTKNTNLLGHLDLSNKIKTSVCTFEEGEVLILQPDCLPIKNTPKILLRLKDAKALISKLGHGTAETSQKAIKHLMKSNITSLIAIHRKSSKIECPICGRVLPSDYAFCPYDSAKLVE